MYADASSFEVTLNVYPNGDVVAASSPSDTGRLRAVFGDHRFKALGFEWVLGRRTFERRGGGRQVVDAVQAIATQDGFRVDLQDKGGLSVLPKKTLSERMREESDDDPHQADAAVLPSGSPTKAMRADGGSMASPRSSGCGQPGSSPSTTVSTCPPTLERPAARAAGALTCDGPAAPRGDARGQFGNKRANLASRTQRLARQTSQATTAGTPYSV